MMPCEKHHFVIIWVTERGFCPCKDKVIGITTQKWTEAPCCNE